MKNLNKTIIICAVIIVTACQSFFTKEPGNCIGIIADKSDTFSEIESELTIENLRPLFATEKNPNASAVCLFAKVSDIRHTETSIVTIEGETPLNGNSLTRKKLLNNFYLGVEQNIQSIKNGPVGTQGSFLVYSIAKMLHDLVNFPDCIAGKKILIFGDAADNNPSVFSIYNRAHFKMLKEKPDSVFALFDREYPLPPPENIEIIFIHQPKNKAADEQYFILSTAFKKYYERHEYKVTITASIPGE